MTNPRHGEPGHRCETGAADHMERLALAALSFGAFIRTFDSFDNLSDADRATGSMLKSRLDDMVARYVEADLMAMSPERN